jgi:signal transduction histidine kinase
VIEEAFLLINHVASYKNVELVAPETSAQDSICYKQIYGDKRRYLQVIINFLSNSLKFSNRDSKIILHLTL